MRSPGTSSTCHLQAYMYLKKENAFWLIFLPLHVSEVMKKIQEKKPFILCFKLPRVLWSHKQHKGIKKEKKTPAEPQHTEGSVGIHSCNSLVIELFWSVVCIAVVMLSC